jgi:hypothetical protein
MAVAGQPSSAGPHPPVQIASTVHPSALQNAPPQSTVIAPATNEADLAQKKLAKKKKPDPPQPLFPTNDNGTNPSSTPTPVNGQPINQYMANLQPNGHHSPSPVSQPPTQSNVPGQQYPQSTQAPSQPNQPPRPPQGAPPVSNFQAAVPPNHFFNQTTPQRNVQPKPNIPTTQGTSQQANTQHVSPPNQIHMYPHIQMQQAATNQRIAATQTQNGRATPQGQPSRGPVSSNVATAQRGSPLVANPGLNSRSPMANSQPVSQMTHPSQHPNFSPMTQSQYSLTHLRSIQNGQHLQQHIVNGGPQAGGPSPIPQGQQMQPSPDQQGHNAQMMAQYPLYGYAQMGMNYGMPPARLPQSYAWPMGLGRGMPINGQHQIPGMASNAGHPQQMLNVGKAVPGGMQGR